MMNRDASKPRASNAAVEPAVGQAGQPARADALQALFEPSPAVASWIEKQAAEWGAIDAAWHATAEKARALFPPEADHLFRQGEQPGHDGSPRTLFEPSPELATFPDGKAADLKALESTLQATAEKARGLFAERADDSLRFLVEDKRRLAQRDRPASAAVPSPGTMVELFGRPLRAYCGRGDGAPAGRGVVRLIDAAGLVADAGQLTYAEALSSLVSAMADDPPPLFLALHADLPAARLDDAHVWIAGAPAHAAAPAATVRRAGFAQAWGDAAGGRLMQPGAATQGQPARAAVVGVAGALRMIRRAVDGLAGDRGAALVKLHGSARAVMGLQHFAPLALTLADAERLALRAVPALRPALALVAAPADPAADARIVQPAGGAWPHPKGKWSDAEKDALRAMRANGMSDPEIAKVAGCKRQRLVEQIGAPTNQRAERAGSAVIARMVKAS